MLARAVHSRDARFDGRFFADAVTTGVYCRSICPVPFAKPDNILWFASAAAAETAGLHPCRRWRPWRAYAAMHLYSADMRGGLADVGTIGKVSA